MTVIVLTIDYNCARLQHDEQKSGYFSPGYIYISRP
jgi:hypothetical protein